MAARFAQIDDTRLARRVAAGDAAAFEVLYDRHHRALLSFCRHMLGSAEDGEDALQQTFLRAHGALRAGQLPDAIRPWLFAIARNRCLSMLAARRAVAVPRRGRRTVLRRSGRRRRARGDLRELVADLGRLPEDQRAAFVLFELGGLSQAEIGDRDRRPRRQGQSPRLPGAHRADGRARRPLHPVRRRSGRSSRSRAAAPCGADPCAGTSSTANRARPTASPSPRSARASPRSSPSPRRWA